MENITDKRKSEFTAEEWGLLTRPQKFNCLANSIKHGEYLIFKESQYTSGYLGGPKTLVSFSLRFQRATDKDIMLEDDDTELVSSIEEAKELAQSDICTNKETAWLALQHL